MQLKVLIFLNNWYLKTMYLIDTEKPFIISTLTTNNIKAKFITQFYKLPEIILQS